MFAALQGLITATNPLVKMIHDSPGLGGAAPFQEEFSKDQSHNRAIIAANQMGKTFGGAFEAWMHLTDRHPWRETFGLGSVGWFLGKDLQGGWQAACECLRALQPGADVDVLDPRCTYDPEAGYRVAGKAMLKLSAKYKGARLVAKGCDQKVIALESGKIQWAWVDEPPKRPHFAALRMRLAVASGSLWLTMTAISRPVDWLRDQIEGDPESGTAAKEPGWFVQHVELNHSNAPHRTKASIRKQIDECDEWEKEQRIYAKWASLTQGRRLGAYTEACAFDDEWFNGLNLPIDKILIGADHGEGLGKEMVYLTFKCGKKFYTVREYENKSIDGYAPKEHARGVINMCKSAGIDLYYPPAPVTFIGDSNSAGMLGTGGKYNTYLEHEIRKALGVKALPWSIEIPYKGGGSVYAGTSALNMALKAEIWFIHEDCTRLHFCAARFTGVEKDLKDAIDAVRYALQDDLYDPRSGQVLPTLLY